MTFAKTAKKKGLEHKKQLISLKTTFKLQLKMDGQLHLLLEENKSWSDNFLHFYDVFWRNILFWVCYVPKVDYIYFTILKKRNTSVCVGHFNKSKKKKLIPCCIEFPSRLRTISFRAN